MFPSVFCTRSAPTPGREGDNQEHRDAPTKWIIRFLTQTPYWHAVPAVQVKWQWSSPATLHHTAGPCFHFERRNPPPPPPPPNHHHPPPPPHPHSHTPNPLNTHTHTHTYSRTPFIPTHNPCPFLLFLIPLNPELFKADEIDFLIV